MPVITTGSFPKALRPGVFAFTQMRYDEHKPFFPLMFEEQDSQLKYEELVAGNTFGLVPVKSEGSGIQYASESQAHTTRATHATYAMGYIVTLEEADDGLYESLSKRRGARLAASFRRTKDQVAANVYNRAANSSYTFGDGKALLATDHPTIAGNQSNALSVAADLSEASLEDICIDIRTAKDNAGNRISLKPVRLLVHPSDIFEACRILESEMQNDTANNAVNALRTKGVIPEVVDNPYFDDTDQWFVRTDIDADNGLIYFNRSEFKIGMDNDSDTLNEKHFGYERYSFTVGDFRALYGSPGG